MMLKFLGGAQEVGRSAILLKDDRSLLFDFGVKLDHHTEYPTSIPKVDGLIVSHAHLDHSGFSPGLYTGNMVPAFGTAPTLKLSTLLLDDSLNIARKQHITPKFHRRQIKEFIDRYVSLDYGHLARFGNFDIEMHDAGHIIGSAVTLVERAHAKDYRRVVYTGDFKLSPQTLHHGAEVVQSDVLIMESTYATREHEDRDKVVKGLVEKINEVLDNGGHALLPAFAVGRSQELMTILYENGLASQTHVDGMSKEATSIALNYPKFTENYRKFAEAARAVNWVTSRSERMAVLDQPGIILTTSGMLNGGPVLSYLPKLHKNSHIFLTGFQQEGTNGKMLLDNGKVSIDGKVKRIDHPVSFHDLSAHAGMHDLHEYAKRSSPKTIICVHGDEDATMLLARSLRDEGFDAHAPKIGDQIKLGD